MKHFINPSDVADVQLLIQEGISQKSAPLAFRELGKDKTLCLLFFNSSLRTRLSTQKAAMNLGMQVMVMNVGSDGWQLEFEDGAVMNGNKAEHIKEAAAVVGQYADIVGVRSFPSLTDKAADYAETVLESFRKYTGRPIINLESATRHPCQSLADLITIEELKTKSKPKVVLTWAPHIKALPQAVGNSFAEWLNLTDYDFVIANPEGYDLAPEFSGKAPITHDQKAAFEGADFIYAKNWSSFENYGQVLPGNEDWIVSADKMALTNKAKFMHCLPVRRGLIVEDAVIDSADSVVIQQAGNRVWSVQAVLKQLLEHL